MDISMIFKIIITILDTAIALGFISLAFDEEEEETFSDVALPVAIYVLNAFLLWK